MRLPIRIDITELCRDPNVHIWNPWECRKLSRSEGELVALRRKIEELKARIRELEQYRDDLVIYRDELKQRIMKREANIQNIMDKIKKLLPLLIVIVIVAIILTRR